MKHIINSHFKVTNEEITKLLTKFIERKTSKKVLKVEIDNEGACVYLESEELDFEEPKDTKNV